MNVRRSAGSERLNVDGVTGKVSQRRRLSRIAAVVLSGLLWPGLLSAHPSHPLENLDYPIVSGFENFFITEDSDDYLAQGGELLLGELNCIACHEPKSDAARARLFPKAGPDLATVGSRLSPTDLRMLIRNPRQVKRGTTMPSLFAGPDRDLEAVEALTHYLASLKTTDGGEATTIAIEGDVDRGRELYHQIGCVACHSTEPEYRPPGYPEGVELELPGFPSIPLALTYLYDEKALTEFLHDPLKLRPAGRMPDMKLTEQEAADISRYLKAAIPEPEAVEAFRIDPARVAQGRELFVKQNCIACHTVPNSAGPALRPVTTALEDLDLLADRSCLTDEPVEGGVPYYYLDFIQKQAIELALKRLRKPGELPELQSYEKADRRMTSLNCYACHSREGKGGPEAERAVFFGLKDPAAVSLGGQGNVPPSLTHVGRKLTRPWLEKTIHGDGGEVRPYMAVRMPRSGRENVAPLVDWLEDADGAISRVKVTVDGSNPSQEAGRGRELMGVNGLGCVTCHGLKEKPALGVASVDLTFAGERLRSGYFRELLLDPENLQRGTIMPSLFQDRPEAKMEIADIWLYLKNLAAGDLPDGLVGTEDFALTPGTKPIVFWTSLQDAGAQSLAVGYPRGSHAGFDTEKVRWMLAWKGDFLTVSSNRSEGEALRSRLAGEDVFTFSTHLPLARLDSKADPWPSANGVAAGYRFQGFRLDQEGVPTMLYTFDGLRVEDRLAPGGGAGGSSLKRRVVVTGDVRRLFFRGLDLAAIPVPLEGEGGVATIEEELKW